MHTTSKLIGLALIAAVATAGGQTSKSAATPPKTKTAAGAPAKTKAATPAATTKKATYKKTLPDSLVRAATIAEAAASTTALASVPNGRINSVALEREGGKLIYSYDIKVAGKSGVEEVAVDALTGSVISSVHESVATEKKEAVAEKKAATPAKKPAGTTTKPPVKKPPVR